MNGKQFACCIPAIFFAVFLSAQSHWYWGRSSEGVPGANRTYAVCTDSLGNNYTAGVFYGNIISFGSITVTNQSSAAGESFLVKYDGYGNALWAADISGNGHNGAFSACTDAAGNVFVSGAFEGTQISFGSVTLYKTPSSGPSVSFDMFVAKYDPAGNLLWAKSAGGRHTEEAFAVACDLNGNLIVAGQFDSDTLQFGAVTLVNNSPLFKELFFVKYDPAGNIVWAKQAGGSGHDLVRGLCTDMNNNIIACGSFESDSVSFGTHLLNRVGGSDGYVVKYDANGSCVWLTGITGQVVQECRDVDVDATGDIYATGSFLSDTIFIGAQNLPLVGGANAVFDIFLTKLDSNGTAVWMRGIGGPDLDVAHSVSVHKHNAVYISGAYYSDSVTAGNQSTYLTPGNGYNLFIAKYDQAGNAACIDALESAYTGNNGDFYIAVDTAGDVFSGGQFANPAMVVGPDTLSAANSVDLFAAKFTYGWLWSSVYEPQDSQNVLIYPNPGSGLFTLQCQQTAEVVSVYNASGELVVQMKNCAPQTQVDLSGYAPGMYMLTLSSAGQFYHQRIVLK